MLDNWNEINVLHALSNSSKIIVVRSTERPTLSFCKLGMKIRWSLWENQLNEITFDPWLYILHKTSNGWAENRLKTQKLKTIGLFICVKLFYLQRKPFKSLVGARQGIAFAP